MLARVTLRVVPEFRLRYVRRRAGLAETLEQLPHLRETHRHVELYWFPHTDTVQLKLHDATGEPARPRPLRRFLDETVLDNGVFGLLCGACRRRPSLSPAVSRIFARFVSEGDDVLRSDHALVSRRHVRFQEMEYALPADSGPDALRELRAWIEADRTEVCVPVELRYVKGDDVFLSPSHRRDSAYVAVHAYRGMEFRPYFAAAEAIFRNHGGRPHWGKLHTMRAPDLAARYPMWERFRAVRRRLDPEGLFLTPYLRSLLGEPG